MDSIFLIAVFLFVIGGLIQTFEDLASETTYIKSETKEREITPEMQKMYENESLAWCREQLMKQETNYD